MQGHTVSSEAIWTTFNNYTTAYSRYLKWSLKVAWTRVVNNAAFAIVGSALVNGLAPIQGIDSIATPVDGFLFWDETDHLVRFEFDRILHEPLGGMSTCLADLVLENTDGRFTPNQNGTIGTAILPNRPLLMYLGFNINNVSRTIPSFKGLTRQPKEDKANSNLTISCLDFSQYLSECYLDGELYENMRIDEIIEDMLTTLGFGTSQYSLDQGLVTIPYAYFDKSTSVGARIKKLCEAEEATFYQDEAGILRLENRRHFSSYPHDIDVWDIDLAVCCDAVRRIDFIAGQFQRCRDRRARDVAERERLDDHLGCRRSGVKCRV